MDKKYQTALIRFQGKHINPGDKEYINELCNIANKFSVPPFQIKEDLKNLNEVDK